MFPQALVHGSKSQCYCGTPAMGTCFLVHDVLLLNLDCRLFLLRYNKQLIRALIEVRV